MKSLTKKLVKKYFSDHWDVTLEQLIKDLNVSKGDKNLLQNYLDELADDGWVKKSAYKDYFEYDPGENHGVWKNDSPPEAKKITDYLNKKIK